MSKENRNTNILKINKFIIGNLLMISITFLHIALIPIYLGIWSTVPSFVNTFSNWIHLVVGLYLVIRFRPFQNKIHLYAHDLQLVFSAGLFMLEALLASMLLSSPWGKDITVYLSKWGRWVESLPFVAPFLRTSQSGSSVTNEGEISPNPTTSTLGGSSYTLAEV
jgi:hypothetical protein